MGVKPETLELLLVLKRCHILFKGPLLLRSQQASSAGVVVPRLAESLFYLLLHLLLLLLAFVLLFFLRAPPTFSSARRLRLLGKSTKRKRKNPTQLRQVGELDEADLRVGKKKS